MSAIYPAFARWFLETTGGNEEEGAAILADYMRDASGSLDSFLWKYLEATGDTAYTTETFRKAARVIFEEAKTDYGALEPS